MGEQARHRLSRSLSERLEGPWGVWGFFGAEGGGRLQGGGVFMGSGSMEFIGVGRWIAENHLCF